MLGHRPGLNRCPGSAGRDARQALLLPLWAASPVHGGRAGCRFAQKAYLWVGRGRISWFRGRLGSLLVDRRGSSSFVTCPPSRGPLGFTHTESSSNILLPDWSMIHNALLLLGHRVSHTRCHLGLSVTIKQGCCWQAELCHLWEVKDIDTDRTLHSSCLLGVPLSLDEWRCRRRLHNHLPCPPGIRYTLLAEAISQMGNYEKSLPVFMTTISLLIANVISNTTSS